MVDTKAVVETVARAAADVLDGLVGEVVAMMVDMDLWGWMRRLRKFLIFVVFPNFRM